MATPIQDLPGEIWKPVVGWEGFYEVSNKGRVKGVDRVINGPHGKRLWRGQILAPHYEASDCLRARVSLVRNGIGHTRKVHTLVADAFLGPRPAGLEICHNNGDASCNWLDNLRYDSKRENALDLVRMRRHNTTKLTPEEVLEIRRRAEDGELAEHMSADYGVDPSSVRNVIRRKTWRHI